MLAPPPPPPRGVGAPPRGNPGSAATNETLIDNENQPRNNPNRIIETVNEPSVSTNIVSDKPDTNKEKQCDWI